MPSWADKLQTEFAFEKFYETRYRELCWMTHGSGLVIRDLGSTYFPMLGARSYREIRVMAMLSARIVLEHFGVYDDAMKEEFRVAVNIAILTEHKALSDRGFLKLALNDREEDGDPAEPAGE